ncbi:MAG: PilZ domain-containing protein [bacterium]|nr:MAG: PilZ domain-containing protein [bacterium]
MGKEARVKAVLLIDPSEDSRGGLAAQMEAFGYHVLTADGEAGGPGEIAPERTVDLVILDAAGPAVDGPAAIARIRGAVPFETVPILVLTDTDTIGTVGECLRAGADDYLVKPIDTRLLYQRLQNLLEPNPRNYGRVPCHVVVEVNTGHDQHTGELLELSEGGAGFLLSAPLVKGDIVKLAFVLPREAEPVSVGAQVVHCREAEGGYQSGVNFIIIHQETKERLRRFWERGE